MPKISIIIPCYNVEKYVEKAVRSAINQTLKDIEIIIINDGSTDNTQQKIESIIKKDNRVKIINKPNRGLSSARNTGIDNARGEYIQHLDGDDWLEEDACERAYHKAIENKLDIVIYDFYYNFEDGNYNRKINFNWTENKVYTRQEALESYLSKNNNCFAVWNKLIKRELYKGIRHPKDISLGEDLATMPKIIARAQRIGKLNSPYIHYLCLKESMSHKDLGGKQIQLFQVYNEIEKFFISEGIYKENEELIKALKVEHLTRFIYCKPIVNCSQYDLAVKEYLKIIRTENLNNLNRGRRMFCKLQKMCPNEFFMVKSIQILQLLIKLLKIDIAMQ